MEIYQGILLGILQGVTEFLPVSSSGHLILGQHFFNLTEPMLSFDISVHMGTLFAIIIVFFKDIKEILLQPDFKLILLIITGSIPTAAIGYVIKIWENVIFSSVTVVGFMLILTGIILWFTKKKQISPNSDTKKFSVSSLGFKSAFFIGVCQGIAVIPGISRSGITISAGLFANLDRKIAAKFSFLLCIPAIIGAQVLQLISVTDKHLIVTQATLLGTLASFITGYIALILLLKIVNKGKLYLFAPYCFIVGIIITIYNLASLLY